MPFASTSPPYASLEQRVASKSTGCYPRVLTSVVTLYHSNRTPWDEIRLRLLRIPKTMAPYIRISQGRLPILAFIVRVKLFLYCANRGSSKCAGL